MAIIDFVKWNASPGQLVWKYQLSNSEELSTWTQLVVSESQEAFVVRDGVYDGPFGAGRHTLSTENLPILRTLIGLPFGGKSPFTAEVWFVNKIVNLDVRWGTPDPIQLQDPRFQIMVPVRTFGQYGLRVVDSKRFLLKLVGTQTDLSVNALTEYFRGAFITKIKTHVANAILANQRSVLEITTELENISLHLKKALESDVIDFGVELSQFNVHSINVPEDDPAVKTLKSALAKRAEMGIVGFDYQQERTFDVLQAAASNEGNAGGVIGAGLGLGMGAAIGGSLGSTMGELSQAVRQPVQNIDSSATSERAASNRSEVNRSSVLTVDKVKLLKELAELKSQGVLSESEFEQEKRKILDA